MQLCNCVLCFRHTKYKQGFPGGTSGKEPACQCRRLKRPGFDPWVGKIPWRKVRQPTLYSCLENPTDRGAWRTTVHEVAKSQIRLKQLSTAQHISKESTSISKWLCGFMLRVLQNSGSKLARKSEVGSTDFNSAMEYIARTNVSFKGPEADQLC